MTVYVINYTLNQPEQNYEDVHEAIEALGETFHALNSLWFADVDTSSAKDVREEVQDKIDEEDQIVVTKMEHNSGGRWSISGISGLHDWFEERL